VLFLRIDVSDFSHALRLERKIKSMKSSIYIQNLKKYPELVQKIIAETAAVSN
jgi:putative endonuclease